MKYSASKWLELKLYLSVQELDELLPDAHFIRASGVHPSGRFALSREEILSAYARHLEEFVPFPPFYLTATLDSICEKEVGENKVITTLRSPVIQCQEHLMTYSRDDGKFRSMVRGPDAIPWGIHLSFPQMFEDPATGEALSTASLPNGILFREMQKWVRRSTRPTPVEVEGKKQNLTARIGKENIQRARSHPKLREQGIEVDE